MYENNLRATDGSDFVMTPVEGIIKTVDSKGCDIVVMDSHGRRGIQKILLGSITSQVLTNSNKPV